MKKLQGIAKVMQNNTICIPKKIRKKMGVHPTDVVVMVYDGDVVTLKKAPSSWKNIGGAGKKAYKKLGGGEKYLKAERAAWEKSNY